MALTKAACTPVDLGLWGFVAKVCDLTPSFYYRDANTQTHILLSESKDRCTLWTTNIHLNVILLYLQGWVCFRWPIKAHIIDALKHMHTQAQCAPVQLFTMLMALVLWKHGGIKTMPAHMWVSRLWVVFWMDLCVCEGTRLYHSHPHTELPEKPVFQYGFVRSSQQGLKEDKLSTVDQFTLPYLSLISVLLLSESQDAERIFCRQTEVLMVGWGWIVMIQTFSFPPVPTWGHFFIHPMIQHLHRNILLHADDELV